MIGQSPARSAFGHALLRRSPGERSTGPFAISGSPARRPAEGIVINGYGHFESPDTDILRFMIGQSPLEARLVTRFCAVRRAKGPPDLSLFPAHPRDVPHIGL